MFPPEIFERIFRNLHPGQIGPLPLVNHYYLEDANIDNDYPQFPSYKDLVAVNRTSRLFYSISSYILYTDITIVDGDFDANPLIDMLLASPNHQVAIRHLRYLPFFWDMHPTHVHTDLFAKFLRLAFTSPLLITLELDFGCNCSNLSAIFDLIIPTDLNQFNLHRLVAHNIQTIDFFKNTALREFTCSCCLSDYGLTRTIDRIVSNPHIPSSLTSIFLQIRYDVEISVPDQFTRMARHCQVLSIIHLEVFDLGFVGIFDFLQPYMEIIKMLASTNILSSLKAIFICPNVELDWPEEAMDVVKLMQKSQYRRQLEYIHILQYCRHRIVLANGIRSWRVVSKVRGDKNLSGEYSALENPPWKITARNDLKDIL